MNGISRAQFALMLHSVPHLGPKSIMRLLTELPHALPHEPIDLDAIGFWCMPEAELAKKYKLHAEAAHCLAAQKDEVLAAANGISESVLKLGIRVMTVLDPDYPSCIMDYDPAPPPILYAYGNISLLRDRKFAVVGSSHIGAHSAEVMRELAGTLSDEGLAAVTSHNTQPYQIVGLSAKSRNAPVVLVLDRGILSVFPQGMGWEPVAQARIWDMRFDPARDLVLSRFRLYDRWIGANARERDRMVFGLADVLVAVETRSGGVMESECLRAHETGREVYVYSPEDGPLSGGNASLIERGCTPISSSAARSFLRTLDCARCLHDDV